MTHCRRQSCNMSQSFNGLMKCLVTGHSPWGAAGYRGSFHGGQRRILFLSFLAFVGHRVQGHPSNLCGTVHLLAVLKTGLDALFVLVASV